MDEQTLMTRVGGMGWEFKLSVFFYICVCSVLNGFPAQGRF